MWCDQLFEQSQYIQDIDHDDLWPRAYTTVENRYIQKFNEFLIVNAKSDYSTDFCAVTVCEQYASIKFPLEVLLRRIRWKQNINKRLFVLF